MPVSALAALILLAAPSLPDGVADDRGTIAIVRGDQPGLTALDLQTGKPRWTSTLGDWPLLTDATTVAVAAREAPNLLRIRLLRLSDGTLAAESKPLPVPAPDPRAMPDRNTASFALTAWRVPTDPRLRVRWDWSFQPVFGIRVAEPPERKTAEGVFFVDPRTARVQDAYPEQRPPQLRAELPKDFKPDPSLLYWANGSWSSAPTPLPIAPPVQGAFAWDNGADRRLLFLRWRPKEPTKVFELSRGASYFPVLALGGRYAAVAEDRDKVERVLLFDLLAKPTEPIAVLPPFGTLCRPPVSVLNGKLLCVREGEGTPVDGGTSFPRELIAYDYAANKPAWTVPLAPRLLGNPVP